MSNDKLLKKLAESTAEQKATPAQVSFAKAPLFEIKGEGIIRLRIIGNLVDPEELPFEQAFIHLGFIHPNFNKKVPLPCNGKGCSMCAYHRQKENQQVGNAWIYKCNQRFIYYALTEEMRVVLLSLTFTQQSELQSEMISALKTGVSIMDLNAGRWIEFTSRKINNRQKYIVNIDDNVHAIPEEIRKQVKTLRPLRGYYKPYKEEDIKKIIRGEKLNFVQKTEKRVPDNQNPEPSQEDKHKYKNLQSMVEKKPEPAKKPVYKSEEVDSLDEDFKDNAQILDDILKDEK